MLRLGERWQKQTEADMIRPQESGTPFADVAMVQETPMSRCGVLGQKVQLIRAGEHVGERINRRSLE